RGAGRDRTTLVFPETIGQITDKEVPYSDGLLKIEANSRAERSAQLTTVLGPAKRGDRTLTVASTAGISPGQWIRLYVYNPISGEAPEFIDRAAFPIRNKVPQSDPTYNSFGKYIYGNGRLAMNDERRGWFAGLDVLWLAKVESVGRNTLTLARPLRIDVRTEWKPEVWSCPPVLQEAGLEDFAMEFPDIQYPGHWKEPGSMAVSISGVDCWARRLRIVDADICVVMNGAHCTASDIIMEARLRTGEPTENTENGETGHFAVVTAGPGTQDNLVANCELRTLYVHNLSCGGLANGNVYSAIRTLYPRFDHHGCAPYENLYTEILCMKGGEGFSMSGGWRGDEPQSGIRDTYWNIRTLGTPLSGIHGPDMWPMMNIIGVDGLTTARPAGDSLETWIESWPGEQTRPSNLYLAQLARRLGRSVG
ncbi:MAG: hypothetical protein GTN78_03915, partial [Gemmatimonadales bacterium]|nr:hypothetical protein [Gemmatimonadales bacterium]